MLNASEQTHLLVGVRKRDRYRGVVAACLGVDDHGLAFWEGVTVRAELKMVGHLCWEPLKKSWGARRKNIEWRLAPWLTFS